MAHLDGTSRIGFIGLGNLGAPMALTLLRDGWHVSVFDIVEGRAEQCRQAGATVVTTIDQLAGCSAVALAVPADDAVIDVLTGQDGLLELLDPGALVILHSTLLPQTADRMSSAGAEHGVQVVDAPVSGGAERAAEGDLTVMVGGTDPAIEECLPLLHSVGSEVLAVGPAGAGAAVKLANQLMMFAALAGVHEGLELATAYGARERDILAAVRTSLGDSWVARNWGFFDQMARSYDQAGTPRRERSWSKDLWDVVAAARERDLQLPMAGLLSQHLASRVESHARDTGTPSDSAER